MFMVIGEVIHVFMSFSPARHAPESNGPTAGSSGFHA